MSTWIALLRGVNVNGITIRSVDLKALFERIGFDSVHTVLASGNVVFDTTSRGRAALKNRIEQALRDTFGYDAWILLVTADELQRVVAAFPFDESPDLQPYVVFCRDEGVRDTLLGAARGIDPQDADPVEAGEGVLYWSPPKGSSTDTAFAKILAKPAYKSTTTTRNVRTLRKIVA